MTTHESKVVVLKFGSSVLRTEADLPNAVHEIYRYWREGIHVVVVVSAFGKTTDELLQRAERICSQPQQSALATLLATGEAASSALLSLALERAGLPARVLDAVQAGLHTAGEQTDAEPVSIDAARLLRETRRAVVVLPGFVGRDANGETTLLGRGGSDYSAIFLAQHLRAHCVLLKDVDGLYTGDPSCASVRPMRFAHANYNTALRVGGKVVQPKAVRFAAAHNLRFSITSIGASSATEIGPGNDQYDISDHSTPPLRIALLGCGTVGSGVYQRLTALPELFAVTTVGIRKGDKARVIGVPEHLITTNPELSVERPCDVVVELIGGMQRAASLTELALRLGRSVVSANKALLACKVEELERLAGETGAELRYSAAVASAVPAFETIKRARAKGSIRSISGVLNGTCNYILDLLADGEDLATAVSRAQDKGYAEADPKLDLNGTDAAQKLVLLARAAFDVNLPLEAVAREGIEGLNAQRVSDAYKHGKSVRLVGECHRVADGIDASVKPIELPCNDPLAQARGVENRLIVETESGDRLFASGQGAGCWPTTEAVMADLFEVRRNRIAARLDELQESVA